MEITEGYNISTVVPDNSGNDFEKSIGIWEYDINDHVVNWSEGFYKILGYQPQDIECSYAVFFDYLLYHEDKATFMNFINNRLPNSKPTVQIRLLTKELGYQWFESTLNRFSDKLNHKISGSIINIHQYKLFELKFIKKDIALQESEKVASVGSWQLNPHTKELNLSKEFYDIFEYKDQVKISIEAFVDSFEKPHKQAISKAIEDIIKLCKPFDLELLAKTANKNKLWVRVKGTAVIDDYGNCILIKGILQDIDKSKIKETSLQTNLDVLTEQNKRLQNFAYIISHNLRSHSGNLQTMIKMYDETDGEETKTEILTQIKNVTDSLTTTIEHVNEIVKIQTDRPKDIRPLDFLTVFKNIFAALRNNISSVNAHIEYDFSRAPNVPYLPAYLESIFQNMITNAIKYRHPDRTPHIRCFSYTINDHIYLVFEDNGIGIDLERHGEHVFGLYKTFHQNTDSRGVGLFITRNQIEALGGSIDIESNVNVGTRFIIRLTK
ncbi:MAG: PAS domain-containing protein [Sphingobacteriaceae bacterium]|nr:MAG: PAS domain-containing protein [Sphingobacteriaceae bacterium]